MTSFDILNGPSNNLEIIVDISLIHLKLIWATQIGILDYAIFFVLFKSTEIDQKQPKSTEI